MNKTYLVHSGIKGQKWGVRRYQNEDGTLTPAGVARYGTYENMERTQSRNRKITVGVTTTAVVLGAAYFVAKNKQLNKRVSEYDAKKKLQLENLAKGRAKRAANLAAGIKPSKYKIPKGAKVEVNGATAAGKIFNDVFLNVAGGTVLKGGK